MYHNHGCQDARVIPAWTITADSHDDLIRRLCRGFFGPTFCPGPGWAGGSPVAGRPGLAILRTRVLAQC